MVGLDKIFSWFREGLEPSEAQFKESWSSFWHKSERLPQTQVLGLNDNLNKLEKDKADKTAVEAIENEIPNLATKDDLQSVMAGLRPMGSVETEAELRAIVDPNDNDSYFVKETKDENGDPYIWRWDANLPDWVNTRQVVYQDVAKKGGYDGTLNDLDNDTKAAQQIRLMSNAQFIIALVTEDNFVIWGKRWNGETYDPKGIPEDVKKALLNKLGLDDVVNELIDSDKPVSASAVAKVIRQTNSQYLYQVLDGDDRILEWTDKQAFKHFPKQALMGKSKSKQYDFHFGYENGKIPFYIKNGKVYANMPALSQLRIDVDALLSGMGGVRLVVDFGDSLTANGVWSNILQALLGSNYKVVNCGVGGENVPAIASRQGGVPTFITESFVLPADTSTVEISSVANPRLKNMLYDAETRLLRQGQGNSVNPCYVQGVECTLSITQTSSTSTDAVWYLRRNKEATDAITIAANTPIFMYGAKAYKNPFATCLWIGQNGGYSNNDDLVDYYKRMIEFSGTSNYVLIGLHTGNAATRADLENTMTKAFGLHYINWRKYVSSLEAFKDAKLEPTQADLDAIAVGSLPPAFWSSSTDAVHLNTTGYTLLGNLVYKYFQMLGFI